jgi:ABC-2 type transport system permease protein
VLAPDYKTTGAVKLIFKSDVSQNARSNFFEFLQFHLLEGYPAAVADRILQGTDITVNTLDSGRKFPDYAPTFAVVLPVIISAAFVFLLLMSAGYAMGAVAGERESRTMEVLITSVSPNTLIRGKVLGIIGISLTLLVVWTVIGFGAFLIGREVFDLGWFRAAQVDWGGLGTVLLIALPNYISAVALMVMVGSTVAEIQEGQAMSGVFMLVFFLPIYALTAIGEQPSGAFSIGLSLLPFTSVVTMGLRNLFMVIPVSQLMLSFLVQAIVAGASVWLAGRAFRQGMLRYGKRIRLREVLPRFGRDG